MCVCVCVIAVVGNGDDDPRLNTGQVCSQMSLGKNMHPTILSPAVSKLEDRLCSLDLVKNTIKLNHIKNSEKLPLCHILFICRI